MDVTIYSKPDCRKCDATKALLTRRGYSYTEEDALEPGNLAAIRALGVAGAPVVIVRPDGADASGEVAWADLDMAKLDEHFPRR